MTQEAKLTRCVETLARILDPIGWLRTDAELTGMKIDGRMAVQLADDPNVLKEYARDCLRELGYL